MKVKIDFQLNSQFGVLEKIIFRLVLNGFTDAREIAEVLPLFSDSVVANAIKTLVNRQILSAKIETGLLHLSDPMTAIIEMCMEKTYELNVPDELKDAFVEGGILISNYTNEETKEIKKTILYELLPNIRLDMYIDSVDFVLRVEK